MTTTSRPPHTHGGIPPSERLRIQSALLWPGDYTGVGDDSDPLSAAVKNFQQRHKAKVTGGSPSSSEPNCSAPATAITAVSADAW